MNRLKPPPKTMKNQPMNSGGPPLGPLGMLADWLFLRRYLTTLLLERNAYLKREAESAPPGS